MSRTRSLLDRLLLPAFGCAFVFLAVLPDLLGIGSPGLRFLQIPLLITGLGLAATSVVLRLRPITALHTRLKHSQIRRQEVFLMGATLLGTAVLADLLFGVLLPPTYVAAKYGWHIRPNTIRRTTVMDTPGQFREITEQYFQNGFKKWGQIDTEQYKLFVIGDSFTQMDSVSNGEEWYSHLAYALANVQLFVYGDAGYGSLQEYMVLDDYIEIINPDAILWQFCTNDYDNNLYELDLLSYPYNNHAVRPYLEDGRIVYRLPLPYAKLRHYSFIADRLLKLYDRLVYHRATRDLESYMRSRREPTEEALRERNLLLEKASEVTLTIMKMVTARAGHRPIYLFNACGSLSEREYRICSVTGIVCVPGISEYVDKQERNGVVARVPNDGHWNKRGNQIAAEKLSSSLMELGLLPGRK